MATLGHPEPLMSKKLIRETFDVEFNNKNADTDTEWHAGIEEDKTTLLISFEGTTSVTDWISNFRLATTAYKNMSEKFYVHTGFLKKWKSVKDTIMGQIRDSGCSKIKLRGLSQGGAVALLCHENIKFHVPELDVNTVVLGCPRVFGKKGYDTIASRCQDTIRIINGNDVVPRLPYSFMGYKHVGTKIVLGSRSSWLFCGYFGFCHKIDAYKKAIESHS